MNKDNLSYEILKHQSIAEAMLRNVILNCGETVNDSLLESASEAVSGVDEFVSSGLRRLASDLRRLSTSKFIDSIEMCFHDLRALYTEVA